MDQPTTSGGAGSTLLLAALARLLRPLIKLLLDHGITYPMLLELLKSSFVRVSEQHFALRGRPVTDSRISLLTGVHRKDVRRLRLVKDIAPVKPKNVALGAQLVARWIGVATYLDDQGQPRPLARLASDGGDLSFERLVESLSKDIRPRSVLDEWLRLGIVDLDNQDRVRLRVDAFVPARGFDEKVHFFAQNIHDHLAATEHNLSGAQPPFLERSVYYDGLTARSVGELASLAERLGMRSIQELNKRAMAMEGADAGRADAVFRMNYGVYYYSAKQSEVLPEVRSDTPA